MQPYNFASDPTFQDVMSRLAGTAVTFAAVWPSLRGAILSQRAPTLSEYAVLNGFINRATTVRVAANAALSQPTVHLGVGHAASPTGMSPTAETPTPVATSTTAETPTPAATPTTAETPTPAATSTTAETPTPAVSPR